MGKYIVKRILLLIPTAILVSLIVFLLLRMLPGDAVESLRYQLQSKGNYEVTREEVEVMLGMDKPWYIQFFVWLWGAVRGDLGKCFFQTETVLGAIGRQLPPSLELGILTLILTNLISIPLGLFCAAHQDSISDYTIRVISLVLMSIPVFWLAIVVLIYPSLWWGYAPPTQYVSFFKNPGQNLQMIQRPLFTPDELKSLPKGTFIVTKTGTHPMRTRLKLFLDWGITFEKPYIIPERAARKVRYADREKIEEEIVRRYQCRVDVDEGSSAGDGISGGIQIGMESREHKCKRLGKIYSGIKNMPIKPPGENDAVQEQNGM